MIGVGPVVSSASGTPERERADTELAPGRESDGPDPFLGRVLRDAFRIERRLGSGAMGTVYQATQLSLGKDVAIKLLRDHLRRDPHIVRRFHREARAASALDHPNCVRVIDFGETGEGDLFIAMELVRGRELASVVALEFPVPLPRIVHVMSQVLRVLGEAHRRGIVHRDLKPENVLLTDVGGDPDFVKVCDFGIAKLLDGDRSASALTELGLVCGTPEYMSPEQARGEALDGRSDLYAVGVMLYELATQRLPFTARTAIGVVTKHITEEPLPPSEARPGVTVHPGLEALVMRALAKQPAQRFASAEEMQRELERLLELAAVDTTARIQRTDPPRRGRNAGVALGALGIAAAAAIGVLRRPAAPPEPAIVARVAVEPRPAPAPPAPTPRPAPAPPPVAAPRPEPERRPVKKPERAAAPERKVTPPAPAVEVAPPPPEEGWRELMASARKALAGGRAKEAIALLERAATLPGHPPEVYERLGNAYSRVSNTPRMKAAYRRYLELQPDARNADVVRAMIED